ncbi:MAG: hypothetical protein METHAR1v1_310025 [Methanothrix sp.]|nr:MAG: hypothetical protein METHAR1v1_310025 [Methanothrix sp.]
MAYCFWVLTTLMAPLHALPAVM